MPNFRYKALTQAGEIVSGSISAPTAAEVARRIEYLGLVPVDTVTEETPRGRGQFLHADGSARKAEDVTVFTLDLALLLKAGARLDDGLELLSSDIDIGRLRRDRREDPRQRSCRARVSARRWRTTRTLFPPMYVALVRVGEASGTLDEILEVLAAERARAEALRRKLARCAALSGLRAVRGDLRC